MNIKNRKPARWAHIPGVKYPDPQPPAIAKPQGAPLDRLPKDYVAVDALKKTFKLSAHQIRYIMRAHNVLPTKTHKTNDKKRHIQNAYPRRQALKLLKDFCSIKKVDVLPAGFIDYKEAARILGIKFLSCSVIYRYEKQGRLTPQTFRLASTGRSTKAYPIKQLLDLAARRRKHEK